MKNQEIPKKLTSKERELQNKNLEQKKEIGQPIQKDNSIVLSNLNKKTKDKNQINIDTKNKIDNIRDELGLPFSIETPPSIKTEQEAIGKLNQEKMKLENQNKINEVNQESQNEDIKRFEGKLRSVIDDISTKSKTMLDALYERQQQQFTPLQNPDEFQGIVSHLKNIKKFDEKFDVKSLNQINQNIQKISLLIGNMHPKNIGRGVRDNPQNLEKLAYGAKTFSASLDEAGRNLGPELTDRKKEKERKELRKSLGILSEQTQNLHSLVTKMRLNLH
ncbi:MAG: hypothetical protein U9R00_02730 [Patescibacteria group bacterium]|nr:hypothetical protein [Patescibacteria group bacterium]